MIMAFEGTHYPSVEDEASIIIAFEPTHTEADEQWYLDMLGGWHDDDEQDYGDWCEDTYDPDGWQVAQDRYDRWVYGE